MHAAHEKILRFLRDAPVVFWEDKYHGVTLVTADPCLDGRSILAMERQGLVEVLDCMGTLAVRLTEVGEGVAESLMDLPDYPTEP